MGIGLVTLKSIAYAITNPYLVTILLILAFNFHRTNKKISIMQKMIIGESINSPLELTMSQLVIGIVAGALASVALSYLGIVFKDDLAVYLMFFVSLVLTILNPRLICFTYSGSIIAFIGIISKMLSSTVISIDVVALMSLIGILHIIEGMLVIVDGNRGAIPVFTNKEDKIIGGYALKRYWILPIAILVVSNDTSITSLGAQVPMPMWWPILKTSIPINILKAATLLLMPFYGVVGYSSITFTKSKEDKAIQSGIFITLYGVVLTLLSQLGTYGLTYQLIVVILAPVMHEGMLRVQRLMETKGKPKYVSSEDGIMVLEVAPSSPAFEMGIKSGDLLVEVNDTKINEEKDIFNAIKEAKNFIWFKIKTVAGNMKEVNYNKMNEGKRLGIVFVPRGIPDDNTVVKLDENKFRDILEKIKNKDKEDKD